MANVSIPIKDNDDISEESSITFTVTIIPIGDIIIMSTDPVVTIVDDDHSELLNDDLYANIYKSQHT